MLGMEFRNSRCNCPNIWRKPYLEDVSILAPSPPIWIPLTFSILPLVYQVSPFLSFSTNTRTPQTPKSWGKWLLPSAGFQNQTTDPSLFQATSSKHPDPEEDSVCFFWSSLWTSWLKATLWSMEVTLQRGGMAYATSRLSVKKWNALPPVFGMRSIKKQNDLESIFQIQWVWCTYLRHFCKYLSFSLRIVSQFDST